jgi:hypothetical protein
LPFSDEDDLERELAWREPRRAEGDEAFDDAVRSQGPRPPGARVLDGLGLAFAILLSLVVVTLWGPAKDLAVVALLVCVGLAWVLAYFLSRRLWVAIGPLPRRLLRPFGRLVIVPALLVPIWAYKLAVWGFAGLSLRP